MSVNSCSMLFDRRETDTSHAHVAEISTDGDFKSSTEIRGKVVKPAIALRHAAATEIRVTDIVPVMARLLHHGIPVRPAARAHVPPVRPRLVTRTLFRSAEQGADRKRGLRRRVTAMDKGI